MWHRCKNLIHSLTAYDALSPDLRLRRRVNRVLHQRPALPLEQWFQTFYQPQGITVSVASFAYEQLPLYSGLDFSRILPSDRLNEDLYWTQVCWFDWEINLCNDVQQQFGIDLFDDFDPSTLQTVQELIRYLNRAIAGA